MNIFNLESWYDMCVDIRNPVGKELLKNWLLSCHVTTQESLFRIQRWQIPSKLGVRNNFVKIEWINILFVAIDRQRCGHQSKEGT